MVLADIDLTILNQRIHQYEDALIAAGQDSDMAFCLKDEGRLLAMEISDRLGPRTQAAGEKKIRSEVQQIFEDGPAQIFAMKQRKPMHGETNITWLYAGPGFLVGVNDEDFQPGMSIDGMRTKLNEYPVRMNEQGLRRQGRGKRTIRIGSRSGQAVMRYNRVLVAAGKTAAFAKTLFDRIGRLRATFAYAAAQLGETKIPAWVKRHIEKVKADGKAIFDMSALNDKQNPSLTFGSRAPGIEGFEDKISVAVSVRSEKLAGKIGNIIDGYTRDWNSGQPIRRGAHR